MKNWQSLKNDLLRDQEISHEFNRLAPKYKLISELISARKSQNLTQKDLAIKVGTKQSAIARLESGNANPSIEFLEKVTHALGHQLLINIK